MCWTDAAARRKLCWRHLSDLSSIAPCPTPMPLPRRCYMEGAGVERSIVKAADCFRQAGNAAELGQLAALKSMYAAVADADLTVDADLVG